MCNDCGEHKENVLPSQFVLFERDILGKNKTIAAANRKWFNQKSIRVFNMMSAPGSGKTSLLARTVQMLGPRKKISILVGDLQTELDAMRIREAGGKAKQIITGKGCHLDASMIAQNIGTFLTGDEDILFLENVGNLACPASFDLGESKKVVLWSITEGEDKAVKYPELFSQADLVIFTKVDLNPHLSWDHQKAMRALTKVNPMVQILRLSIMTGEGLDQWLTWCNSEGEVCA